MHQVSKGSLFLQNLIVEAGWIIEKEAESAQISGAERRIDESKTDNER